MTLAATNSAALVQFYAQLLEQTPNPYILDVYAEFQLKGLRLGIFQPKESHHEFAAAGGGMSLCFGGRRFRSGDRPFNQDGTSATGRDHHGFSWTGNLRLRSSRKSLNFAFTEKA